MKARYETEARRRDVKEVKAQHETEAWRLDAKEVKAQRETEAWRLDAKERSQGVLDEKMQRGVEKQLWKNHFEPAKTS